MRAVAIAVLVLLLAACGDDPIAEVGDERASQARQAALEAGLDDEIAGFIALLARGETATYRVTYPGPTEDSELVVTVRPPDRRVDLEVDGEVTETRLTVDGTAYRCRPEGGCERTDAFVAPPGIFTEGAVEDLRASLVEGVQDFTFELDSVPVAGVEARCLVTRRRADRARPELGAGGTICLAPSGAVLLVDRGDQRLEALDYSPTVQDSAFDLPDDG